jgi:phosphoribosylamine---glycine ligase
MNILLLGNGGREHALAWKISQSAHCDKLYIAPGNAGTSIHGENIRLNINDHHAVGEFAKSYDIHMVVVGPEETLVHGIADYFHRRPDLTDILFVGPRAAGARLEGSKAFAKAFMQRHGIPTASYRSFSLETLEQGKSYLQSLPAPYVLKADGLAAGKGVIICESLDEAINTLEEMLESQMFGEASATVVVEDFLKGMELSVFVVTDGTSYKILPSAKDYKRIGEDDTGPNTGGMGAFSPVPFANEIFMRKVEDRVIKPTIDGLAKEGIPYCGFIFFGLIEVGGEPYVIEYNVRLGDPETQAIVPRVQSDLVELFEAAAKGTLGQQKLVLSNMNAATVVLVSGGYPGNYDKGYPITNIDQVSGSLVFYAGVSGEQNSLVTSGGRVLAITTLADKPSIALETSYKNARLIDFKGKYYRRDIGKDILQ